MGRSPCSSERMSSKTDMTSAHVKVSMPRLSDAYAYGAANSATTFRKRESANRDLGSGCRKAMARASPPATSPAKRLVRMTSCSACCCSRLASSSLMFASAMCRSIWSCKSRSSSSRVCSLALAASEIPTVGPSPQWGAPTVTLPPPAGQRC